MDFDINQFGALVFDKAAMKKHLPYPAYQKWQDTIEHKSALDRSTADAIAHAMKEWAIANGCTHYTHWFQPLNGTTAEKHESFLDRDENDLPIMRFSGKALIKGEPDASSFPSGGLRATFEARGYTYWDCTSPAFIQNNVLCIPTIFVSYTGEALDRKSPLLRSIDAIDRSATRMVNLLGDKQVHKVVPVVGLEQEYFLVERSHYAKRLDLRLTGQTLFGRQAPKSQELEDHYFGHIPSKVQAFMDDLNIALWKLGIYAKTEHNEAAPNQFELAPIYGPANIAVDQNQLIMNEIQTIARAHGLEALLHEKPFKGINGSGKHDNYSLVTDDGQNLFAPGERPMENIRFLVFLTCFIAAVDDYAPLLRMSASLSAGNDLRLGADEAPPAIISIYLGSYLDELLHNLLHPEAKNENTKPLPINAPISTLAYIPRDNTDRNRTSPMAFTGNKFEFRMLGSSMSASEVNTVLNTILAKKLDEVASQLEGIKYIDQIRSKALSICIDMLKKHQRILFSGDGYSAQWVEMAKQRGLPCIRSVVESYDVLMGESTIALFEQYQIYSKKELESRSDVLYSQYEKTLEIESRTALHMITRHFLPAMVESLGRYAMVQTHCNRDNTPQYLLERCKQLSQWIDHLHQASEKLRIDLKNVMDTSHTDHQKAAKLAYATLVDDLTTVRSIVDEYEKNSSATDYGLPTYDDILFGLE